MRCSEKAWKFHGKINPLKLLNKILGNMIPRNATGQVKGFLQFFVFLHFLEFYYDSAKCLRIDPKI